MKKIILIGLVGLLGYLSYLSYQPKPILSPQPATIETPIPKRIVGFLPYWQIDAVDQKTIALLDEVIYFGLTGGEDGSLRTDGTLAKVRPLLSPKTKLSVAIVLQDNSAIETFLSDSKAQAKLIENVEAFVAAQTLDGVNLDFEYSGIPGKETVAQYVRFVDNTARSLKKAYPNLMVSVDVTADAIKKSRLYDVEQLAESDSVDYIILMGYDFYRPTSSVAGPVSPLLGKEIYEYDVTTAVLDFRKVVPKEKLLLGVAYYGWDFPTVDETKGSFVEKRQDEAVALSTYKRSRRLMQEQSLTFRMDEESQTPWMIYRDPDTGGVRQIWFENETSLGKKYDLVNRENLAGIAIWALGYDGAYPDLFDLLKEKFRK